MSWLRINCISHLLSETGSIHLLSRAFGRCRSSPCCASCGAGNAAAHGGHAYPAATQSAAAANIEAPDAAQHLPPPPAWLGPVPLQPVDNLLNCGPWHCERMLGEGGGGQIFQCVLCLLSDCQCPAHVAMASMQLFLCRTTCCCTCCRACRALRSCVGIFRTACAALAIGFAANPQRLLHWALPSLP